jgi:hypothetical protein
LNTPNTKGIGTSIPNPGKLPHNFKGLSQKISGIGITCNSKRLETIKIVWPAKNRFGKLQNFPFQPERHLPINTQFNYGALNCNTLLNPLYTSTFLLLFLNTENRKNILNSFYIYLISNLIKTALLAKSYMVTGF